MNATIRFLSKYRSFSSGARQAIWRAVPVLWVVRILLSTVSYRWLETRVLSRPLVRRDSQSAAEIALGVNRAARLVPAATCLTRSLAAAWLLRGAGYEPRLCIGVARDGDGFKAHAWLECEGDVVVGGEIREEYLLFERAS